MKNIGLREANQNFSKFMKVVKEGNSLIITERKIPIAVIKPLSKGKTIEEKIMSMEEKGLLRPALKKGKPPLRKLVAVKGIPVSKTISKDREDRF